MLLTHSRQDTFKVCRRKHWYAYELGLRRIDDAKALRMGSAYHDSLESLSRDWDRDRAIEIVRCRYDVMPAEYDRLEWEYECETVVNLVCGYEWRWGGDRITHHAAEHSFELPLVNPATGAASKLWSLAGKIDGIVSLEDRRLAVLEHKLLSEDLEESSALWRRLRIDHQISMYVLAARQLGYPVDAVLYNVTRKPTIRPTTIPLVDDDGLKIVLDRDGDRVKTDRGSWRQTGDKDRGWELQSRPMTVTEWGEKLADDIGERPGWYYQRREIARLDIDIQRYREELWDIQRVMRDAQLNDRHYRTCNRDTCAWCPYFEPCSNGWEQTDPLPGGFVIVENRHPELGALSNVNSISETATASTSSSTDESDSE